MKIGKASFTFKNVYIEHTATVAGKVEAEGPLLAYFDSIEMDPYCGQNSWEKAEIYLTEKAIRTVLHKAKIIDKDVDIAFGGDLVNQMVPTNYAMREFDIPFMGVYSACASSIQALILGATYISQNLATRILAFASSHNNMAEKQFRSPVEYAAAKPDTAQFTVTGAGVALASSQKSDIIIESATIGTVVDYLQKNAADMGSAMAPAAAHTIVTHFKDFNRSPADYDLIITGDLAKIGSLILVDLLKEEGYDISEVHKDCGNLIYNETSQTFAGGSGAGCCPVVTFSYVCEKIRKKEYKKVLVVATGALLNSLIVIQKETIPCVAHAICLEALPGGDED